MAENILLRLLRLPIPPAMSSASESMLILVEGVSVVGKSVNFRKGGCWLLERGIGALSSTGCSLLLLMGFDSVSGILLVSEVFGGSGRSKFADGVKLLTGSG